MAQRATKPDRGDGLKVLVSAASMHGSTTGTWPDFGGWRKVF